MSSSPFTALLLVHRLVGKSGQANLLRSVINNLAEQTTASTTGSPSSSSQLTNAANRILISTAGAGKQKGILYIYLWQNQLTDISSLSRFSTSLYAQASSICPSLDVRLLLRQAKNMVLSTTHSVDILFLDSRIPKSDLTNLALRCTVKDEAIPIEKIDKQFILDIGEDNIDDNESEASGNGNIDRLFDVVALGGTFDRIHNGHKLLLTESVLRCKNELIVGVTDDEMVKSKSLYEMILPFDTRLREVKNFLGDITPSSMILRILSIADPYGPAITDSNIQLLVLSEETIKGGNKINEIRKERNLPEVVVFAIQLYAEPNKQVSFEENKISSSTQRIRNLGERLRPPMKEPSLPYIIGLTGGIASGKSTIGKYLTTLGAGLINCDQLAHEAYRKGTNCFQKVVETFGTDVIDASTGEINRKAVGAKVFGKPEELKKLTDIVWPEIKIIAAEKIEEFAKKGFKVVVLDAAVLFEANWESMCHEAWVTFIPREEAIKRIQDRDKLSKEDGEKRIDSQLANKDRLKKATFAFSSLWEVEFTRSQVLKSWNQIQELIKVL